MRSTIVTLLSLSLATSSAIAAPVSPPCITNNGMIYCNAQNVPEGYKWPRMERRGQEPTCIMSNGMLYCNTKNVPAGYRWPRTN
ncbi:hypothetical protein P171DRAFT_433376 [Karstenula rhodostoma CBS 690.94]|uniref:Uncharacterized protein n=1 Tax=Karstenula rhodostoma CBS 690.94 TaxID=1392251 RepID=A0A9P4PFL9_9PLEO|nr:hypothetical protein P171DRAFT_433376 [Karstenula rhodostoma CBS 690.94]